MAIRLDPRRPGAASRLRGCGPDCVRCRRLSIIIQAPRAPCSLPSCHIVKYAVEHSIRPPVATACAADGVTVTCDPRLSTQICIFIPAGRRCQYPTVWRLSSARVGLCLQPQLPSPCCAIRRGIYNTRYTFERCGSGSATNHRCHKHRAARCATVAAV